MKELATLLKRDTQLRYAQRELEMQRKLMGKGGRRKVRGVERVDKDEEQEDDDDFDINASRRQRKSADEETLKPRIYKWRLERKR